MPLILTTVQVAPVAFLALFVGGQLPLRTVASPAAESTAKPVPTEVEVRCIDESILKLKILEEKLECTTRYGSLRIPVSEIRRIEFCTRTPTEVAERVNLLISNLNHPDYEARERATTELRNFRERAYFPLLKAIKHQDPEISRRAEETVRYLVQKLPASQLEPREFDVIHTDDSKITCKIVATVMKVETFQFGEQSLRLADLRSLRSAAGIAAEEIATASVAPANLMAFQNQFGKELTFAISSSQTGGTAGGVWGTDIYSLDSQLGPAAIHAGLLQPGQSGVVRIRIVTSPPQFAGTFRNGIGSNQYALFPAGAFEFIKK